MRIVGAASVALLMCLSTMASADEPASDETITAIAPLGMSEADLGRPYSARFEPLIGKEGRTLFPKARKPRTTPLADWTHSFVWFESELKARANARALTFTGSLDASSSERVVIFRALQLTSAVEIDDTTEPRQVTADGAFYVRRIVYGRVCDVMFIGSREVFTAGVRAEVLAYGGSAEVLARKLGLRHELTCRGLAPRGDVMLARNAEEVRAAYTQDKSYKTGRPQPVLVEYRRIPGASIEAGEAVEWAPGPPIIPAGTKRRLVIVAGSNSDWTDTGLIADKGDVVVGFAKGKVTFGWKRDAKPNTSGPGGLSVRVGTDEQPAGTSWAITGPAGPIKLRVRDNHHEDNKGEYEVDILLIPAAALGDPDCKLVDANGSVIEDCSPGAGD